jgi:hypothetical protein
VHFFILKKISELKKMALENKTLIDQNTVIYIPMQFQNIFKDKFDE